MIMRPPQHGQGVFPHSQSSCHIGKVVLALGHDSRQIPIASDASPRHTSRGFLHWAYANLQAPVRAAPPSWGRHPQTFTIGDIGFAMPGHTNLLTGDAWRVFALAAKKRKTPPSQGADGAKFEVCLCGVRTIPDAAPKSYLSVDRCRVPQIA